MRMFIYQSKFFIHTKKTPFHMMRFRLYFVLILSLTSIQAIIIDCLYDYELFFDDMKLAYTCTVRHLTSNRSSHVVKDVIGNHSQGKNNSDVVQLYIFQQKMNVFPQGLTDFFENIEAIHAGMNELKYLEQNDMKSFVNLRFLYLYSNLLESLQSDVFLYNTELEYVSFYNNTLDRIGSKILKPLTKLNTAYFNKNICIDKQAVHSKKEVAEIKLEIAERCSDITDEDLMNVLGKNQAKIMELEESVVKMSKMLESALDKLSVFNKTEL
jgi:hypothetical protein